MNHVAKIIAVAVAGGIGISGWAGRGRGATYYVDFDGGVDHATGLTPQTAFKHAPCDAAAKDAAKAAVLGPGDTVIFKGGVMYRGALVVRTSGAPGKPITFDGNTAGSFGQGPAIIDGADAVTDWQRCTSAADAKGNPKWADIFYADVPAVSGGWRRASLCDEHTPLAVAQDPKPADPIFQEDIESYHVVKARMAAVPATGTAPAHMTLTDPGVLTQTAADYYEGMTVGFHGGANALLYLQVLGYDPARHALNLESYPGKQYAETGYSLFNSVKLIARPGEFSEEPTADRKISRVFLMPEKLQDGVPAGAGYSRRSKGFDLEKASDIAIQGFTIRRQSDGTLVCGILDEGPANDLTVRDCDVSLVRGNAGMYISHINDVLVEHCKVHDNPGHTPGIVLHTCDKGTVRDCTIQKNTATGLDYYTCTNGQVIGNTVLDQRGMHANGLTFYVDCKNILIEGNYVARGQCALTLQDGQGFTIRNNIFTSNGRATTVSLWTSKYLKDVHLFYNCILASDPAMDWEAGLFSNSKSLDGLVVRNNIIDGLSSGGIFAKGEFGNNLYTRMGADQKDGHLAAGEHIETDLAKIFVNAGAGDFHLRQDGPAIGAGVTQEGDGTGRPAGQPINVGPYEEPPVEKR